MGVIYVLSVVIALCVMSAHCYQDNDLTAEIPPGRAECYYQPVKAGMILEIEYQVVDGGDLDIDFQINGPNGNSVVNELRKTDGVHTVSPTEEGDYEMCFDNSFSRFTGKSVFFEIIIDNEAGDYSEEDEIEWNKLPHEEAESKLAALEVAEDTVQQIKVNNAKSIQLQALLRAYEAKDRNVLERNWTRINFWSVFNIVVMLAVFAIQVFMVRNMFSDNRKVRT